MGYAKRSVKNKARVEASIFASYLYRETTHFFIPIILTTLC